MAHDRQAYKKQWNLDNKDRIKASKKQHQLDHPEKYIAATRRWQNKNPEYYQALKDYNFLVALVKKDGLWENNREAL